MDGILCLQNYVLRILQGDKNNPKHMQYFNVGIAKTLRLEDYVCQYL
jgi:hypothetical protein